jgi:hypothetical protein
MIELFQGDYPALQTHLAHDGINMPQLHSNLKQAHACRCAGLPVEQLGETF